MNIKGFDKDLKCRDFQFEIGKTYETNATTLELCTSSVFHYCKSLQQVHNYYSVNDEHRFCEIEVLGEEITDGEKCGSNKIKILREIIGEELDILAGRISGNTGLFNSGYRNSGDRNSGYMNSGYMNSGDRNSGYMNSGYRNSGDRNSGDMNSGYRNSGDMNSGSRNSGDMNSGNRNSGDRNSGYRNSGDRNSGYMNSGDRNSGNRNSGDMNSGNRNSGVFNACINSNGVFCTQEPKISIFNISTDMTLSEFYNSRYFEAICSSPFDLTEWKDDKLTTHSFKDACANWWEQMDKRNREIIMSIPNFNAKIFKEITGIEI